jgi:putative membrane protein
MSTESSTQIPWIMKTSTVRILVLALISVAMLSCNSQRGNENQSIDGDSTMNDNSMNQSMLDNDEDKDMDFMEEAALGGLMEVELGKYAQQNAVNPRVRNFGAMMVKDHSKANDELKALAAKKNILFPTALDEAHLRKLNNLKEKKGADFDKAYMDEMLDDHQKDTDKFKRHAEDGMDPDIRTFASKTLPVLLMHQDSARTINDALK